MSMIKYVSPSGWDFDRPAAVPVKLSSRGLLGADRQEFLKTASHVFLDKLDQIKVAKDEAPVHLIALGSKDGYGANRNGDGWESKVCRSHHPTFVKFARYFLNHKNKPERGDPHFGLVKASVFNEPMHRVELLITLNANKEAAERNGGFVDEAGLEKLARGEDLPVSMAASVPFDSCSFCGNKARTRDEYCTSNMCKAGGCKDNLSRLVKVGDDLHHLHVINPPSTVWFDISRVFRPADRIAYGAKADYLTKAAADNGLFALADSVKMASEDTAPLAVVQYQDGLPGAWSQKIAAQLKLGYGLAALEAQEIRPHEAAYRALVPKRAFDTEALGELGTEKCAAALGALADRKIILHVKDFARLAGKPQLAEKAASRLPGVYRRMRDDGSLERRVEQSKYPLSEKLASSAARTAANLSAGEFSLDKEAAYHRSQLSVVRREPAPNYKTGFCKLADDSHDLQAADAEELARDYAVYKLAALERIASFDDAFPATARLAIRQNHVF